MRVYLQLSTLQRCPGHRWVSFFFKEKIFFNTCHTVGHTSRCPIYSVSRLSAVMNSAQFAQLCTEQVNSDWLEKVVLFVYFLFKISSAYWKFY